MNLVPGALLAGKYRIVRHLGDGAMGSVWEALNVRTQRRFALKLLRSEVATGEARERMLREAHAAGRLQHKNVIEVYDVGETASGDPFLVMELLQGETLEELAARSAPLPMAATAVVGVEVCRALAAAHDAGIIHRDLKPANVFIHRGDGDVPIVKVLDFGVSKITGDAASATTTGAAIGSPAYMSPEQAKGTGGLTARADLWSLGVVLYELGTGRPAFDGETAFAVVGEVLHGPLPTMTDPALAPLATVIARCLVRDPAARIGSARELGRELEAIAAGAGPALLLEPAARPPAEPEARPGTESAVATRAYVRPLWSSAEAAARRPPPAAHRASRVVILGVAAGGVLFAIGLLAVLLSRSEPEPSPLAAEVTVPDSAPAAANPPRDFDKAADAAAAPTADAVADATPPAQPKLRPKPKRPATAPQCPPHRLIFNPDGTQRCGPGP
ncbi:MAG: serine/threonine protein kinase [Polyangiaceae bacterium]|nr:serine/threonine protein kinase [Polyangiaceae bacterium]